MTRLTIDGKRVTVDAILDAPLLWVLHCDPKLTGTRYGCGIAQCGAHCPRS